MLNEDWMFAGAYACSWAAACCPTLIVPALASTRPRMGQNHGQYWKAWPVSLELLRNTCTEDQSGTRDSAMLLPKAGKGQYRFTPHWK
jgi:hypothetical protein